MKVDPLFSLLNFSSTLNAPDQSYFDEQIYSSTIFAMNTETQFQISVDGEEEFFVFFEKVQGVL